MSRLRHEHVAWARAEMQRFRLSLADSAVASPDLEALGLPHSVALPREGYLAKDELERMLGARLGAPGARVLIVAGASGANACAFLALAGPGDEVLVEIPGYEPHRVVPALFGATVRGFDRPLDGAPGALAAAAEAALGPRTRLLVLADLHNPVGVALDPVDARALDLLAERRGFRILCDETFRDSDRRPTGTLAALSPRWITTASLTKVYGLGGLRFGWIAGDPEILEACEMAQDSLSTVPSLASIGLARALVPHLDALRARTHQILDTNLALFSRFAARDRRFAGPVPRGLTMWREWGGGDEGDRFATFAGERFDLALARGSFFGRAAGVRITLGDDPARFAAALETLERASQAFPWKSEPGAERAAAPSSSAAAARP